MKDLILRYTSRKFLLAIAAMGGVIMYPEQADKIVTLALAFIGVEGGRDAIQTYAAERTKQTVADARTTLRINGTDVPVGDSLTSPVAVPPQNPAAGQTYVPGQ